MASTMKIHHHDSEPPAEPNAHSLFLVMKACLFADTIEADFMGHRMPVRWSAGIPKRYSPIFDTFEEALEYVNGEGYDIVELRVSKKVPR